MKAEVTVKLTLLRHARARPALMERVYPLVQAYLDGADVPPIPVRITTTQQVWLNRDGNHRLAAARLAQVETIRVCIDARDAARLAALAARDEGAR